MNLSKQIFIAAFGLSLGCLAGCGLFSDDRGASVTVDEPAQAALPARSPSLARPSFEPMQAIIKRKPGGRALRATSFQGVASLEALPLELELAHFDTSATLRTVDPEAATWEMIRELRARPDIEYAHPNWYFEPAAVPSDPLYSRQWSPALIALPAAWDLTTGTPTTRIAILDLGRTSHPDLSSKWVPGLEYDATHLSGNPLSTGGWAHAVHVAGIAAASANNGLGTAGVCSGCQLLNIKAGTTLVDLASAVRGIHWAVDNGAQVINMSFGGSNLPCSQDMTGIREAIAFAISRNVSVVAAAGNQGVDVSNVTPASCPGVISVAATDRANNLAQYSNRGPINDVDDSVPNVTLAAPGGAATLAQGSNGLDVGPDGMGMGVNCPADPQSRFGTTDYGVFSSWTTSNGVNCERYLSGTSMAAPHVSGVIGLMLSRNPTLTPGQIRQILQATAQPLPGCGGRCGAGLLNARAAVEQAAPLPVGDARPTPRFTASCSALTCTFNAASSTDDRGIVAYQWTLPGQQRLIGGAVTSFMPGYGMHLVELRVTDTTGQSNVFSQYVTNTPPNIAAPLAGSYYNPQRSGAGIDLFSTSGGELTLSWYTYLPNGEPVWYTSGVAARDGAIWSSTLYRSTSHLTSGVVTTQPVGTVALHFSDPSTAWLSWILDGVAGGERYIYAGGGEGRSGAWYPPARPGWGLQVQEAGSTLVATVAFYHLGQPRWMQGAAVSGSNVYITLNSFKGGGLCPSCGGTTSATVDSLWNASSMTLQIANGASTTGSMSTFIRRDGLSVWVQPNLSLQLLTSP